MNLHGSMVALVTPMNADGSFDDSALERLVEFHIENGTDAIVAVGSTGESATLDFAEHIKVMRQVVELADGRVPVIGGTGSNSTREALELTREAKRAGCDACLLITPYYNKPTQQGLYLHYKTIAEQVDVPVILYNVPGRTACDMLPETVARLAEIENIIGIKEAFGTLDRIKCLVSMCGSDFAIISGEDALTCESILAGGKGVISVTANVAPRLMHEMCSAALKGEREKAMEIDSILAALHKSLFLETNPIPVKWAVKEMGLIQEGIRLPMTPFSDEHHESLRAAMRQAGVID